MLDKVEVITLKKDNIDDFAKERNELLSKAKKDWVFFIDSDEIATPELEKEIDNLDFKMDGYFIKRKNLILGKVVGEDKVLRLAKKNAGKWERLVHEQWKIDGKVGTLKNYLIHNTANSLSDAISKINFYSTLHAKQNKKDGKKSNLFKIVFFPVAKFFESLFTGKGFAFAMLHSFHSFLSWGKLYTWQNE